LIAPGRRFALPHHEIDGPCRTRTELGAKGEDAGGAIPIPVVAPTSVKTQGAESYRQSREGKGQPARRSNPERHAANESEHAQLEREAPSVAGRRRSLVAPRPSSLPMVVHARF